MRYLLLSLMIAGMLLPAESAGQLPLRFDAFSVELRGEIAHPTSDFDDEFDLDTGFGFGLAAKYWPSPFLALYGGWDRFEFDGRPDELGVEVVDQGFRLGAQAGLPRPLGPVTPFVLAGLIWNRTSLEVRDTVATTDRTADRALGYEVGGGLTIPLTGGIWLVPEARFRSHASSWETVYFQDDIRTSYLAFNLGLVFRLRD